MERNEPTALAENGWQFYEKCNCQRTLKYRYIHPNKPGLKLEWIVRFQQFSISDKGLTKVPLTKLSKLDEVLKSL